MISFPQGLSIQFDVEGVEPRAGFMARLSPSWPVYVCMYATSRQAIYSLIIAALIAWSVMHRQW